LVNINKVIGTLCNEAEWSLSNLSIQKSLYLIQMFYMGHHGEPLFQEDFQAWDYGPVQPDVYHDLKMFGGGRVKPMSYLSATSTQNDYADKLIKDAAKLASQNSAGKLVEITHWKDGAWAKHYSPNVRGILIPKTDILAEYRKRAEGSRAKKAANA